MPFKVDCDYAYVLGHICYHIMAAGLNGYMATLTNLKSPSNKWCYGAAPVTATLSVSHDGRYMACSRLGNVYLGNIKEARHIVDKAVGVADMDERLTEP